MWKASERDPSVVKAEVQAITKLGNTQLPAKGKQQVNKYIPFLREKKVYWIIGSLDIKLALGRYKTRPRYENSLSKFPFLTIFGQNIRFLGLKIRDFFFQQ